MYLNRDVEIAISHSLVNENHIVNFSNSITGELGIKNSKEAFSAYHKHHSSGSYEIPSTTAYESAVAIALKEKQQENSDDDLLDAIVRPQGKKASTRTKSSKTKRKKGKAAEKEDDSSGDEELKGHLSILQNCGLASSDEDSEFGDGEEM